MADNHKYVKLGSVKRDENKFTVKHSTTKEDRKAIDKARVYWALVGSDVKYDHKKEKDKSQNDDITLNRKSYYPYTGKKIDYVHVKAIGRKGGKNKGKWSGWRTFNLKVPGNPTVSATAVDDTGTVKFDIKKDHPKTGAYECARVWYQVKQTGSLGDKTLATSTDERTSFSVSKDIVGVGTLTPGQYAKVTCTAKSQGYAGQSAGATASHIFCCPNVPVITGITLNGDKKTGTVVVSIDSKQTSDTPVDTLQLYHLHSEVTTKEEAANATTWHKVEGAVDDGDVSGLSEPAATAIPVQEGLHVWFRVEAIRGNRKTFSEPFEFKKGYVSKSTTSAGSVTLQALEAGDGWAKISISDTEADDDCVRMMWSDYEDAWESTDQPDHFDVTWLDKGKAAVYVRGLTNGTRYWFRARSVDTDADGKEILGGLSNAVEAIPSSDFGVVSVTAPQNVGIGADMEVSWEFSSDMAQEQAQVMVGGSIAVSIEGAETKAVVPGSILEKYAGGKAVISVTVVAGGSSFTSKECEVVVADLPTCSVTASDLAALPFSFGVSTDSPNSPTVTAYVISHGSDGSGLDGDSEQMEGDCIWSGDVTPDWTGDGPYAATITCNLDEGQRFWQDADYTVTASLHDPVTNLDSVESSADFTVYWAHQADVPVGSASVDAESRSVTVTVTEPTGEDGGDGYVLGDRFDLYRISVDGEKRIAEGLPFGSSVTDRYAPFGKGANLRYMAVTRTSDGDYSNSGAIAYTLDAGMIRFDWGEESLELPYNIEDSSGYEKGFSDDVTLEGSTIGWWDGSSRRKSSLRTSLIKLKSADQEEAIASMARYAGPVFVRTPSGAAFSANVVPSDVSRSYDSGEVSVSLDCAEVELTAEHKPEDGDISRPTWNGGAVFEHGREVYDSTGMFPLDTWQFAGYSGQTLYVVQTFEVDGESRAVVRDGSGAEKSGWTWDGTSLTDSSGNVIPLTEVAG